MQKADHQDRWIRAKKTLVLHRNNNSILYKTVVTWPLENATYRHVFGIASCDKQPNVVMRQIDINRDCPLGRGMIANGFSSQFRLNFEGQSIVVAAEIGAEMAEKPPRAHAQA